MKRRRKKPRRLPKPVERAMARDGARQHRLRPPGDAAKSLEAVLHRATYADRILAKCVLGALADEFTQRDILQRRWLGLSSLHGVSWGLRYLVERGDLRSTKMETGGRPRIVYRIALNDARSPQA